MPAMKRHDSGATHLEQKFIDLYLVCMNHEQAAKQAGYPEKTARKIGERLLRKAYIFEEINKRLEVKRQSNAVTEQKIIESLASIAFFDPADAFENDGSARPLSELPAHVRVAITGVEQRIMGKGKDAYEMTKYQIADKMKALELLGKYLALFTEKLDIKGEVNLRSMDDDQLTDYIRQLTAQSGAGKIIDGTAEAIS